MQLRENKRRNDEEINALRQRLKELEVVNDSPDDEEENVANEYEDEVAEDDEDVEDEEVEDGDNEDTKYEDDETEEEDEETGSLPVPEVKGAVNGMNDGVLRMVKSRFKFLECVGC